jgi:hypothetical protein
MNDDGSFDDDNGALRAFNFAEAEAEAEAETADDADEYSLNDIGLVLRIRSEQP